MNTGTMSFEIPKEVLSKAAAAVRDHYRSEFDRDYSKSIVETALRNWLDRKVDFVLEEMPELLTLPGSDESIEFARILQETAIDAKPVHAEQRAEQEELHPVFSGNRAFSPERLTAMMAYLAQKGADIYKTKLNKLLFYADLTGYYLTGQGMSGAQYVKLPYGPVPNSYEEMIDLGVKSKKLKVTIVRGKGDNVRLIQSGENAPSELTQIDRRVLDWVIETYGNLSTSEISNLSHEEMAYKFTHQGEPIAYRYAEFLKTLPPKDLLDN
jgi:uncharacterized phage-associated protein